MHASPETDEEVEMAMAVLPRVASRPATHADERLMRDLFADTREDFFLLDPDVRHALLDMQYRARRGQVTRCSPSAARKVLLIDGTPVGCLEIAQSAECTRILDLAVAHAHRRRGVATSTLLGLMDDSRSVAMTLSAGDERFGGLLAGLGFEIVATTDGRAEFVFCH